MKRNGAHLGQNANGDASVVPAEAGPLTLTEAVEYLNVTERFMRRLVAERRCRRVPYHKLGRLLRFLPSDLDDLLREGRVEAKRLHSR